MRKHGDRVSGIARIEASDVRPSLPMLLLLLGLACCVMAATSSAVAAAASCPNAVFKTGESTPLPDCRVYEQVSPIDKAGFSAYPNQATPAQVSSTGDALAYLSYQAFPGALGNTALFAAHLASRSASGWGNTELTPPIPQAKVLKLYLASYAFSDDLSRTALTVPLFPLTPEATPGVFNLFLRHPDGSYSLINAATPTVSAEQQCQLPFLVPICFLFADRSTFAGASSDFTHVLFESTAQLTEEAPETGIETLYESVNGHVRLVGILPDGQPAQTSTAGAGSSVEYISSEQTADQRVEHAISSDGSTVIFQAPADGGQPDPEQAGNPEVYARIDGSETIELSAPAPGATPAVTTPEPAKFWAAAEDGSRVFFTSSAELTSASNTGPANNSEDLYEYDLTTRTLTDLTVDTNPLDATTGAMVQGVTGTSSDGAYVYFVANGELVPGKGVDNQPNLYVVHEGGEPVFIATLSSAGSCGFASALSADSCDWVQTSPELEAYVTPNGQHLAFMSTMSIPTLNFPGGYNNIDQNTGLPDSEVYEYTVPGSGEEGAPPSDHLLCVSCDASGAPPVGNALIGGIIQVHAPTFTGVQPEPNPYHGIGTPFYRVRSVSEDGARVVYSAPVPNADPNDRVFEYERGGVGSCTNAGGCKYAISSSALEEPDQLLGISTDGRDVFVATARRLVAGDQDNLKDVYDARVDGGFATGSQPSSCEAGCQTATPSIVAPALTGDRTGPSGNLPKATPPVQKPLTRAQKLAKALHACRVKANKRKRIKCEASARRRYGPAKKPRAKNSHNDRRAK